jgi:hypothetical protein
MALAARARVSESCLIWSWSGLITPSICLVIAAVVALIESSATVAGDVNE